MSTDGPMQVVTAQELRNIIEDAISGSIELHRGSRVSNEGNSYDRPEGRPTDEEIDDFLMSNPLLDEETQEQLLHEGLLGFNAKTARASEDWIQEFRAHLDSWAQNNSWLGADLTFADPIAVPKAVESSLWRPANSLRPGWLASGPAALLLANDLLRDGRLLSEMPWRTFEEMIGTLLEAEGWIVQVTQPSRDGGIDVVAVKEDKVLGPIKSIWQAKRYGPKRVVRLNEIRELSAIVDSERATKGVVVTTSRLTKDAIDWIRRDTYRLGYKDARMVESWVRTVVLGRSEKT
jgi:restriction system protein